MLTSTGRTLSVASGTGRGELRPDHVGCGRVRPGTLLNGLRQLGKMAAWRADPSVGTLSFGQVIDALAEGFGRVVVSAVLVASEMQPEPQPAVDANPRRTHRV